MHSGRTTRSRGVVMVITLLALILLAALLFFVINLGRQVNRRVITQHSADAAATAGAGWVARSMNQVAMNNVSSAHMIAAVNSLDGIPMAVAFAHEDQIAVETELEYLLRGQIGSIPDAGDVIEARLEQMHGEIVDEGRQLDIADTFFRQPQNAELIVNLTFYETPNGDRGRFWQSVETMEQLSIATVEALPDLAQAQSNLAGEVNMPRDDPDEEGSLLLPTGPVIPFLHRQQSDPDGRTSFRDFERPVRYGRLPLRIDHPVTNRGPFDAVFGWRDNTRHEYERGGGSTPISRDGTVTSQPDDTYYTYGTQGWLNRLMRGRQITNMRNSRIDWWINVQANIKNTYLWENAPTRTVIDPEWVANGWRAAQRYFDSDTLRRDIRETCFIITEMRSKYPATHPGFMTPGTWMWAPPVRGAQESPVVVWPRGAHDPREWGVTRITDSIWRDEYEENQRVISDPQIGITPVYDANGDIILQPVYRIDHYLFIAINIGENVDVRNPHNFDDMDDLPGPVHLNHELAGDSPEARRRYLTFLGIALQDDDAIVWPGVFRGDKPFSHMVAMAQAKVFNDHSWDLWTPMWRSQIRTVDGYGSWVNAAEDAAANGVSNAAMTNEQIQQLADYLRSTEDLGDVMMAH